MLFDRNSSRMFLSVEFFTLWAAQTLVVHKQQNTLPLLAQFAIPVLQSLHKESPSHPGRRISCLTDRQCTHVFEAAGVVTFSNDKKFLLFSGGRAGEQSRNPFF